MKRIEKLDPALEARLPAIRDEWIAIGLSTEPADRPAAEASADVAYKIAGLPPPPIKIWLRSPLEGTIGASMLANVQVGAQVRAQVGVQVRAQVVAQVRAQVRDQVRDQVWDQVGAQVGAQVWDQVWDQVGAQVWDQVGAQVWDQVGDQVYRAGYGLHDANWAGFYSVFSGLVPAIDQLSGLTGLAKSCGWFWPFQGAIILTERPCKIGRDDDNRLHCDDGPALAYPDGFSLWRINGVVVDEQIVMRPETQTLGQVREEPNAEVKRIRISRYGWDRYLKQTKATVLDHRRNDVDATTEALVRTPEGETVLIASCASTGRVFNLEVPPGITSAAAAQDWLSGGLSSRTIHAS